MKRVCLKCGNEFDLREYKHGSDSRKYCDDCRFRYCPTCKQRFYAPPSSGRRHCGTKCSNLSKKRALWHEWFESKKKLARRQEDFKLLYLTCLAELQEQEGLGLKAGLKTYKLKWLSKEVRQTEPTSTSMKSCRRMVLALLEDPPEGISADMMFQFQLSITLAQYEEETGARPSAETLLNAFQQRSPITAPPAGETTRGT